jgi:hypothetical protein
MHTHTHTHTHIHIHIPTEGEVNSTLFWANNLLTVESQGEG